MGYRTNNPELWAEKDKPTELETQQLQDLLINDSGWYARADRWWKFLCSRLGYPQPISRVSQERQLQPPKPPSTQTAQEWAIVLQFLLLQNKERSARRKILEICSFKRKQVERILIHLYILAQILVFETVTDESSGHIDDGRPHHELEENFRNSSHSLLRAITFLCRNDKGYRRRKGIAGSVARFFAHYLRGSSQQGEKPITPNAVADWARVAAAANGAQYDQSNLLKRWEKAEEPAWKGIYERAKENLGNARGLWKSLVWLSGDRLCIYYLFRHMLHWHLSLLH